MGIARSALSGDSPPGAKNDQRRGTALQEAQIRDYRNEANHHRDKYHDFSQQAKGAWAKGQKSMAHTCSQHAHTHKDHMHEANRRAVGLLVEQQQQSIDRGELDLHGFYVAEALDVLKSVLVRQDIDKELTVITGKGLHSTDQVAKIRPAVIKYLKNNKYTYTLEPGVVVVDTRSGSPGEHPTQNNCCIIL